MSRKSEARHFRPVTPCSYMVLASGVLGFSFVAEADIEVQSISLRCATSNTGVHTVHLQDSAYSIIDTVNIDLTGCDLGEYVSASASGSLVEGQTYYLVTEVTLGGQPWADAGPATLNPILGTFLVSVYGSSTAGPYSNNSLDEVFVGLSLVGIVDEEEPPPPSITLMSSTGEALANHSPEISTLGANFLYYTCSNYIVVECQPHDSEDNDWTCGTSRVNGSGIRTQPCWVYNPITSATHSFWQQDGSFNRFAVLAFSGLNGDSMDGFDQENGDGDASPGSVTGSTSPQLYCSALAVDGGGSAYNIDSSFTKHAEVLYVGGSGLGLAIACKVMNPSTAQSVTWSVTGGFSSATSTIATFK